MSTLPLLLSLADELDNLRFYETDLRRSGGNSGVMYQPQSPLRHYPYHPALSLFTSSPSNPLFQIVRGTDDKHYGSRRSLSTIGKDGFQIHMDVQHFKPNELTVKTIDNHVVVEGKHEEREDEHGFIQRHFIRRFALPSGYDPNQVVSTLSSDGILTVTVPPPQKSDASNERVIQIQQTGPAHLSIKNNPKVEADGGEQQQEEK